MLKVFMIDIKWTQRSDREIEAHVARGFRQKNSIALSPEASDRCSSSLWIEVYLTNLIDVIADSVRLVNISFACISKDNLARVAALWFGDFKDLICSCCNARRNQRKEKMFVRTWVLKRYSFLKCPELDSLTMFQLVWKERLFFSTISGRASQRISICRTSFEKAA